jgi:hypothetical protein
MSAAQPVNQFHFRVRAFDMKEYDGRIFVICLHDRVCENKQTGFNVLPSCYCPPDRKVERCNYRLYGFFA